VVLRHAEAILLREKAGEEFRLSEFLARLLIQAIYNESTSDRQFHFFPFSDRPASHRRPATTHDMRSSFRVRHGSRPARASVDRSDKPGPGKKNPISGGPEIGAQFDASHFAKYG
jgi:hypothetical protein